ncbi:hypothetical protein ACFWJT_19920 [Streptomyces sp. NPDC127069]|uniref:hypothetical protein n=1 Tax=Streptomyces sp. NPDC127069 TaxID=3347128 RepID=UPI0036617929
MTHDGDTGYTRPHPGPCGQHHRRRPAGPHTNMQYDVGLFAFSALTEEADSGATIEKPA